MRKIMEPSFYFLYLALMIGIGGFLLILGIRKKHAIYLVGCGCLLLAFGDAFHLIPRAIGLFTDTLDAPSANLNFYLGIGKLITSITMTLFYVLLYIYGRVKKLFPSKLWADIFVGATTLARIVLCAFPQNQWNTNGNDLLWGILRNIPFLMLGIFMIIYSFLYLRKTKPFSLLYLAMILSWAFYIPVVIGASTYAWLGMMMIPKTICYLWMGVLFLLHGKSETKEAE